jgi:hypothetical protein
MFNLYFSNKIIYLMISIYYINNIYYMNNIKINLDINNKISNFFISNISIIKFITIKLILKIINNNFMNLIKRINY